MKKKTEQYVNWEALFWVTTYTKGVNLAVTKGANFCLTFRQKSAIKVYGFQFDILSYFSGGPVIVFAHVLCKITDAISFSYSGATLP